MTIGTFDDGKNTSVPLGIIPTNSCAKATRWYSTGSEGNNPNISFTILRVEFTTFLFCTSSVI